MASHAIGQMGSTTEFFKLNSNRRISWSVIQHAGYISYERSPESLFFDNLRVHVRFNNAKGSKKALTRMMTELAEVSRRREVLAANMAFDKRVEEIEKHVLCLWNAPGAPGYETARLEFEELQRTNDQMAGESSSGE
ncbi:hypothetical protein HDU89_008711 [Geranomyces variabilis]|nr:hypothetical protein HDU89_008711 [Geranomyces variabilis]